MTSYLEAFRRVADNLGPTLAQENDLLCKVGTMMDCAVLKVQKLSWTNDAADSLPNESGIFFSLWVGDESLKKNQILYNIHALKLRQLQGYTIQSRDFAAAFRAEFARFHDAWPNVRVDYGPLTLMQGWQEIRPDCFEEDISQLVHQFVRIHPIIDNLLEKRKIPRLSNAFHLT